MAVVAAPTPVLISLYDYEGGGTGTFQTMTNNIVPGAGPLNPELDPHVWLIFQYAGDVLPIGFEGFEDEVPINAFIIQDNGNRAVTTAAFVTSQDAIKYKTYWLGVWDFDHAPPPPPTPIPIGPAALEFHLTGGIIGVTNANPSLSLGGQMAILLKDNRLDNLWDPISSVEQDEGTEEYRWIVLYNNSTEPLKNPHFWFAPKDEFVDIEFSRLAVSAPVTILEHEFDRPVELEIGPEVDVPMPFTKSTESYDTSLSVSPDIPPQGKLYICVRRVTPQDAIAELKAYVIVVESRVPGATP